VITNYDSADWRWICGQLRGAEEEGEPWCMCDTTAVCGGGGKQTGTPTQQGIDGQKNVSCICGWGDMASAL
jgi:hypothetical protein